jgi:hypothetical protein
MDYTAMFNDINVALDRKEHHDVDDVDDVDVIKQVGQIVNIPTDKVVVSSILAKKKLTVHCTGLNIHTAKKSKSWHF